MLHLDFFGALGILASRVLYHTYSHSGTGNGNETKYPYYTM